MNQRLSGVFICLLLLITSSLIGQNTLENVGLITTTKNPNAPEATEHWGKLVGNWDIIFESVDASGTVQQEFEGEWNWFYMLNGHAIQDVFILPPRNQASDPNSIFYGVGIRIFDEDSGKWQSVWVDTSNKILELREASSTDEKIILHQTNAKGEKLRISYFDIAKNSFEWKQEVFDEKTETWILTQLIHAKRRH